MKKLLPLLLILFFGCKEEYTLAPVVSYIDFSIRELRVAGVPQENIQFKGNSIFITLPADYPHGNVINVSVKPNRDFTVESDLSNGVNFEAKHVNLRMTSPTYSIAEFPIYVKVTAPLKIISDGEIEIVISPEARLDLTLQNFGTIKSQADDNQSFSALRLILKNVESSDTIVFDNCNVYSDSVDQGKINVTLPVTISAGKYQATIEWGNRKAVATDLINVKHGKLALDTGWFIGLNNSDMLLVSGHNIYPENEYEIEITNDFAPSKRYKLTRDSYNTLSLKMPDEIKPGNYSAQIFVNGKLYDTDIFAGNPIANLVITAFDKQPIISIVSQPTLLVGGVCYYYKPTTAILRAQDIVTSSWVAGERVADMKLKLVHRESKKEFLLTSKNPRFAVLCFNNTFDQYTFPKEAPNGEYEAYAVVESAPVRISEPLGQIITVK